MFSDQDIDILVEDAFNQARGVNRELLESTLYSMWLDDNEQYSPAVNIKTCNKLPSGVYKVIYQDNNYRLNKVEINSDEIFTFSEDFTSRILEEINSFWSKKDLYKENKLLHKRGMLLEGGAGCGKTSIITLLINQLIEKDGIIFLINNYKDFSILSDCLKPVFRKIEPERPIITVIEDIDKIISENGGNDMELLDFLDGKNSINHHIVIMTSNDTSNLSEAFLRPSRVDMRFVIPAPDAVIRKEYFEKKGIEESIVSQFVDETSGMSFAQLKEIFIGTQILNKPIKEVANQLRNPLGSKDYLNNNKTLGF